MKKGYYLFFLLLILPLVANSQSQFDQSKISNDTAAIVKSLENGMVAGPSIGIVGVKPQQYNGFIKLLDQATEEELIHLTRHQDETIRGYAFWVLASDKHSIDLFPFINEHLQDNEMASVGVFGCNIGGQKVGDFLINIVKPGFADTEVHSSFNVKIRKFNAVQIQKLNTLLLTSPNTLKAKSELFLTLEPTPEIYPRIRELVMTKKDHAATVVLAKYKKQQDVQLILKSLIEGSPDEQQGFYYAYQTIIHFPHPDFFSVLNSHLKKEIEGKNPRVFYNNDERRALYDAIALYKNDSTITMLNSVFNMKQGFHRRENIDTLFAAVRKYIDPIYESIFWTLWQSENRLSYEIYEYLSAKNPEKSYQLSVKTLENIKSFLSTTDKGLKIIRNSLKTSTVLLFTDFATDKIIQIQDKSFIEPLFEQLDMSDNIYILITVAKTLMAFKDKDISTRVANEFDIRIQNLKFRRKKLESFLNESELKENQSSSD